MQASGAVEYGGQKKEEGDWIVEISNNTVKITGYKGNDTVLQIPSQIRGLPVSRIYQGVLSGGGISSINIPDDVFIGGGIITAGHIIRNITIGKNVTIEGDYFDTIALEDFVKQWKKLIRNDDGTVTEKVIGNPYIPFYTVYKENGRKAGTFNLIKDESGMDQWVYKAE